ncbi:chemotaxis protein histidine kinase and related kinases [Pelotomaculum thermopropionicum SI]|uniref:Chemotaxis protein CheA n=1 Tax=Pelotomaculum thermopropionicum (strain DSM 13744 / JCM 10971 / SI) TaxID=370438 RepID=A5D0E6_PELTS|nr:chemotaxis protein histidine kinase and related kinases [Pelotomaculum thermopropionicum SI]
MFSEAEIGVFLDELEEKIQCLNENILVLEREGGSEEALQEIFRAAHTIKGSSAVMGYEKMASLTHEMENLFDQMRKGLLPVSAPLVDTLFLALDTLQALRDEVLGKEVAVDVEGVIEKLRQCQELGAPSGETAEAGPDQAGRVEGGISGELQDVEEEVIREAEVKGFQAYWVRVELDRGCQMKSARAFLLFETLSQVGEVIKCEPPAEDLQEGRFDFAFRVVLLTKEDPGRVRNLLLTVSEVAEAELERVVLKAESGAPKQFAAESQNNKPEQAAKGEQAEVKLVQTVRVDVQRLDTLMNLVGELVIDRTRLNRFAEIFEGRFGAGSAQLVENLNEISAHLGQVTSDLQEQIMKARMLPVAQVFNRFPRMVRDLAQKMGKEINFIVEGHETELDRNIIEVIGDPLIHLIRNAVDHGIEGPEERAAMGKPRAGTLKLKASYMENHIIITVQDDGRGIDPARLRAKALEKGLLDREAAERMNDREAMNLIFMPGFSTAAEVSDLSGRGVGMDVVRTQIEQINGTVEVASTVGAGTTFTIKLPLTLAIIRALMVGLGNEQYAFPLANVVETISAQVSEIKKVKHSEVILVRGNILPLVRLSEIFGVESCGEEARLFIVVLGVGEKKVGVIVDRLVGELEIVIKSLGDYLGKVPCISGATILGDGQVALIVDVRGLLQEIGFEEAAYAAG